jgi:hypothetical protein
VRVIRARERQPGATTMDMSSSPTFPALAGRFPQGEDVYLPEMTHFIPMEAPAFVAAQIIELADRRRS